MASSIGKAPKRPVEGLENTQEELEKVAQALPINQVKGFALHWWNMLGGNCTDERMTDSRVAYIYRVMVPGALLWQVCISYVYAGRKDEIRTLVHYHAGELHVTKTTSEVDYR